MFKNA